MVLGPGRPLEFEAPTVDETGRVTARAVRRAERAVEALPGGVALELVAMSGGGLQMGAAAGEGYPDEIPQHRVRVAPFFLGRYPVTQAQWAAVMGEAPRCRFAGERCPVDNVSWYAARRFCRRLRELTARRYRLPGEAQWEYACRAGTTTPFACGPTITTDLANYMGELAYRGGPPGLYRHTTTDVGSFPPNAFGLYDMHGNVWEWCADWYDELYYRGSPDRNPRGPDTGVTRVLRGGSFYNSQRRARCAARVSDDPYYRSGRSGCRVVVTSGL